MKKEYLFIFTAGLFLLAYVLEAVVNPLNINLATPYDFLKPTLIARYPFTSAILTIKTIAIFLSPLLLLSYLPKHHLAKGLLLIVLSGLAQLYTIQEVATGAKVIPMEWSLSITFAALALLLPAVIEILLGLAHKTAQKLSPKPMIEAPE